MERRNDPISDNQITQISIFYCSTTNTTEEPPRDCGEIFLVHWDFEHGNPTQFLDKELKKRRLLGRK